MKGQDIAQWQQHRRLYMLGAILVFWCCAICLRLGYLQIFRYGELCRAAAQRSEEWLE